MTTSPDALPVIEFPGADDWQRWLESNPDAPGVWLRIAKKGAGIATVTYDEALDVALCLGWIDGLKRGEDERYFLQRFTPRRPRSLWSKRNVARVEALIAAGRMQPAGLREVQAAQADGRWQAAYAGASAKEIPPELAEALAANPNARAVFDRLDSANRYAFCWRVQTGRRAATKDARVRKFIAMLERGETLH